MQYLLISPTIIQSLLLAPHTLILSDSHHAFYIVCTMKQVNSCGQTEELKRQMCQTRSELKNSSKLVRMMKM